MKRERKNIFCDSIHTRKNTASAQVFLFLIKDLTLFFDLGRFGKMSYLGACLFRILDSNSWSWFPDYAAGQVSNKKIMKCWRPAWHTCRGLFKCCSLLARILQHPLKTAFMDLQTLRHHYFTIPSRSSPLFMDSGTPDILMLSAMPPTAATFIFMASVSCPSFTKHLVGHLGKTSPAQATVLLAPQLGPPSSFYGRRKRPMGARHWDLCSQSEASADLWPEGSEGWDGMLKCLNCGMHWGGAEREGVKVIRPLPLKLINMDVFVSDFF